MFQCAPIVFQCAHARGWAKSAEFVSSVATVLIVAPMTELPLSYLSEQLARWIFYKLILSFVINMKAVWGNGR